MVPKTRRKRNGEAAIAAESTTPTRPKKGSDGGTPGGGREEPETAVEPARAAEIALVANLSPTD